MTKRRILASILCVMMVLTMVPMMAFANGETVTTYATIEDITGFGLQKRGVYAFTDADAESLYTGSSNGVDSAEVTFDTENGMTLSGTAPRWRIGSNNSSSLGKNKAIYFRAKVEEGNTLNAYFHIPDATADQDAYEMIITPEGVLKGTYSHGAQVDAFVPGNNFVDYLIIDREDGNGMFVYAKSADQYDGNWVCVLNMTTCNGSLSASSEVYFTGSGVVQELILYNRFEKYQSIQDIVGKDILANRDYDFTVSNAQSLYGTSGCGFDFNEVSFDSTNGMTLSGSAPRWRFGGNNSSSLGENKAIYLRAKVAEGQKMTWYFHVPDTTADQDAYEVIITPEAVTAGAYSSGSQVTAFVPGTEFVEYLAVDREDGDGLYIYAKKADLYDGNWVCILNETVCNGNLSSSSEVYITGSGSVQAVAAYAALDTYDDIPTIAGATLYPYKSFHFTESYASSMYVGTPTYDQLEVTYDTTNGMVLSDSNLEDAYGPRWRYYEADAWSAIADGRLVYFKAKVNSAEEQLTVFFKQPEDTTEKQEQAYKITISAGAVSTGATADSLVSFAPGTDWAEYLAQKTDSGMAVYARKDGFVEGKWLKVIHTETTSAVSKNSAVYFNGSGAVNKAMIYTPNAEDEEVPPIIPEQEIYDSIQVIVGSEVIPYKSFDMSNTDYQSEAGFIFKPKGDHTPENGAPIDSSLEGGAGFWRYNTATENWSPLDGNNRVAYFKVKVEEGQSIEVKVQNPAGENKYGSFIISPDAFGENNFSSLVYAREGGAGTDFVEYLMVQEEEERIRLYAKGLTDDGKWVLAAIGEGFANSDNANIGLYFAGDGYLKQVVLFESLDESLLYNSMEDITGEGLYPYKDFKFTLSNFEEIRPVGKYDQNEVTFGTEDGLVLSGEAPRWRFADSDGWSAIDNGRVVYFKAKADSVTPTVAYFKMPNDTSEKGEAAYTLTIGTNGVKSDATAESLVAFAPGTDWAEYLITKTETGMAVYARQDGFVSGKWIQILHATATANISKHSAVYFTKAGSVQNLTIYDTGVEFTTKDTLKDIAGNVVAAQYLDFGPGFDITVGGGTYIVTEPTVDENGMLFSGSADWRFYNVGGSKWSPLENGNVAVFRAKLSDYDDILYSYMKPSSEADPEYKGKVNIEITASGVVVNAGVDVDMKFNFAPGTDWAEYLVQENDNNGYNVWVKAELFGNNKWYLLAETSAFNYENGSGNMGYRFRCNDTCQAYLDYAHVYTANVAMVEENVTLPAGADVTYYEEAFDGAAMRPNTVVQDMVVADGKLGLAEGKTEGSLAAANVFLPKGGYAEFKTAGHKINTLIFSDGSESLQLAFDGVQVQVGTPDTEEGVDKINLTNGGNTYRTWRVLRNADGTYTGFAMTEGEGVWVKVFENKAPVEDITPAQILIAAGNTNVKYDYFKVCGPALAPEDELTIYDGAGNASIAITEGKGEISYYEALRIMVKKGDSKKTLILAEVKDGLLTNLVSVPVEAGTGYVTEAYSMKDESATLKVLLWEDFDTMNIKNIGAQLTVK